MPFANYQYYDDLNNLWQVTLPSDFAGALNLTPALGSEPYLDPTISPRYANYRSLFPTSQRSAVVGTTSQFGSSVPSQLIVNGTTFQLLSLIGEIIPPFPFNSTFLPSGVQGPPGTFGSVTGPVIIGNNTSLDQIPTGLSGPQVNLLLPNFSSLLAGLAPASGGGTSNFLRADGSWDAPSANFSAIANNEVVGNVSGSSATPYGLTQTQITAIINTFSSSLSGAVPASGGGTSNYLRADGSWDTPTAVGTSNGNSFLASNTTMTTANADYLVSSVTNLTPGTYLVISSVCVLTGSSGGTITTYLTNGGTQVQTTISSATAAYHVQLSNSCIVVVSSTSDVIELQASCNTASAVLQSAYQLSGFTYTRVA